MTMIDNREAYRQKKEKLLADLKSSRDKTIGLNKSTSNLFRHRNGKVRDKVDLSHFNGVIYLDAEKKYADVEGMATYEDIVDALLPYGVMPTVVPELKSITLGGAVTGVGIESSSFRYGLVHETVLELDVLLSSGEIVTCNRNNEHSDLFYGFPNSYATLGYGLRVRVMLQPIEKFVHLKHVPYHDFSSYFMDLKDYCNETETWHFIDGSIFSFDEMYITLATFTDEAPGTSDYTYMRIYYKSIREKSEDWLTAHDYIWRWDTDWFWCSHRVRFLAGKKRLRSTTYWNIRKFCHRHGIIALLEKIKGKREAVIQDVEIPVENAEAFIAFFQKEIKISPIWVCPTRAYDRKDRFTLYSMDTDKLYVNFGFWDTVPAEREEGYNNRLIEDRVESLNGKKSLYSDAYYSEEKFWELYNRKTYDELKAKYDPGRKFKNLYTKCVKGG
jgi:FAD/FMN-containing dehydrogenase